MTPTTVVSGGSARQREAAIASTLATFAPDCVVGIILEGMADGGGALASLTGLTTRPLARIAAGCLCCSGNLTMRVTLNRMLRHPPQHLFISLADNVHLDQVRAFLREPPYDAHITLTDDLPLAAP